MTVSQHTNVSQTIKDVLALIEPETGAVPKPKHGSESPEKQIKECLALLNSTLSKIHAKSTGQPVRTIHHLSCTGGTLITKCIAALPNILVLNEVDPLSPLPFSDGQSQFTPTDMVALLRQGDARPSPEAIIGMFAQQIAFLRDENALIGRSLVVRDHSHSQFLTGDTVPERPTVRDMLSGVMPVRSIVTVRDPIDSYLSLRKHGWHKHFSPPTFDEYCRRYLIFLDKYKEVDIVKYEDFVAAPEQVLQKICGALELDYSEKFTKLFSAFQFSGDSGRGGNVIEARPRRERGEGLEHSRVYSDLCQILGYS